MVYINLPGGTAPTWLLKRSIIPNICILISSVTLTRTPVNKAINQRRVRAGDEEEEEEEEGSVVRCVSDEDESFIPESITQGGTSFSKYLIITTFRNCGYREKNRKYEMLSHTGPQFIILFWFYTTYIITIKAQFHMSTTYSENRGYQLRFCA